MTDSRGETRHIHTLQRHGQKLQFILCGARGLAPAAISSLNFELRKLSNVLARTFESTWRKLLNTLLVERIKMSPKTVLCRTQKEGKTGSTVRRVVI